MSGKNKKPLRVYEKTVACPVCAHTFAARVMRHYLFRKVQEDTDFCPYYQGSNPLLESVWVCPQCHYASAPDDFFDLTQAEKEAIARLSLEMLQGMEARQRVRSLEDAILNLHLASHCYRLRPGKVARQASHFLKTAWLYRYAQDKTGEREFLRLAVARYREVFENSHDFPKRLEEIGTAYLVAELSLRLGMAEEARKWLALVLFSYPEIDQDDWRKRMARRRMEDVRDALAAAREAREAAGVATEPAAPQAQGAGESPAPAAPSPPEQQAAPEGADESILAFEAALLGAEAEVGYESSEQRANNG